MSGPVSVRDLLPTLWSLGVVPVLVYIGSWWAWFARETARRAHPGRRERNRSAKSGLLYEFAPAWLHTLWQWTWKMLDFHAHLLDPDGPSSGTPGSPSRGRGRWAPARCSTTPPADGPGCGEG